MEGKNSFESNRYDFHRLKRPGPVHHVLIECRKTPGFTATGEMQGIGEIQTLLMPVKRHRNFIQIFHLDRTETDHLAQSGHDHSPRQAIGTPQHLLHFQQNGLGDENALALEQRHRPPRLVRIIVGDDSDDHVSIDRDHVVRSRPGQWLHPFPPAI